MCLLSVFAPTVLWGSHKNGAASFAFTTTVNSSTVPAWVAPLHYNVLFTGKTVYPSLSLRTQDATQTEH
jgi:hypothetical protein